MFKRLFKGGRMTRECFVRLCHGISDKFRGSTHQLRCRFKIAFLMCFVLSSENSIGNVLTSKDLERTDRGTILALYQMIKDTHELFAINNLKYWITGGTLLGAVRHRGIIPWDNDIDINILKADRDKLFRLEKSIKLLGYELIKQTNDVYVIYNPVLQLKLDVIFTIMQNDKVSYSDKSLEEIFTREGTILHFLKEELWPLKLYGFGKLFVWGPANPHPYLYFAYGPDYLTHTCPHTWPPSKQKILLLKEDLYPAEPMGPLSNKIALKE